MESLLAPQTGRLDRHVRRSYVRLGDGVSRHRISYSLEEALRLASLPGEEEGRIYCFRRVSLAGIPTEANRKVWMERVQQGLSVLAAKAVHASDAKAVAADEMYFNNLEEALETLLRNALRAPRGAAWEKPEWFSASLLGIDAGTSYSRQIPAIVERLRPPAFAPGAAAAILFAALGDADPAALLSAIPTAMMREWMRELEGQKGSGDAPSVPLPEKLKFALQRAASQFGWKDPCTVWLTVQAVLSVLPGTWISGTAVKRARATLRMLEAEQRLDAPDRNASAIRDTHPGALVFDDDDETIAESGRSLDTEQWSSNENRAISPAQQSETNLSSLHVTAGESPLLEPISVSPDGSHVLLPAAHFADGLVARPPLMGSATQAAGLFFLLNGLRRAGIVPALDACPALAEACLAAHILRRLASHAGVDDNDPILLCLHAPQKEFMLNAEVLDDLLRQPKAWPVGFAASSRTSFDSEYFLRVWILAVKRWCWRSGRLTIREIVQRKGRVWQTRTDIDVTLPLAGADLRIRRTGLDIDPGWLPWFGVHGRVVRFHYRDREPGAHAC